jgi:DNA helicase-2/ATP-dependent DNA helicase PcrA
MPEQVTQMTPDPTHSPDSYDTPESPASPHDSLLDNLTEPQLEAVEHVDGPMLVLAGAGSGKTRVVTRRAANLVLRVGIPPWNILAITFTNKAAGEMRERVGQLVSERQSRAMTVCTFHSLCVRLLRTYAAQMNLTSSFSIYDTADQQRTMKQVLKQLGISTSNFSPGQVLGTISNAKNDLIASTDYANQATGFYERQIARIYPAYQAVLKKNNALDFDDLLMLAVHLLRKHEDVLEELRDRFQYLLVDEYQDTNHAQYIIAQSLAGQRRNLCVTGDPDQSIYAWRGADIRNILDFEDHYPDAKVVRLEQNYRSTQNILAAADKLITRNTERKHKSLWTENEQGAPVRTIACMDERHEARWVIEQFQHSRRDRDVPWGNMAVFYRINSLSRLIEEELVRAGIPYQVARGASFYDRKEVKDSLAYLRMIANPVDEVALVRVINTPARGISEKTIKAMQAHAAANDMTVYEVLDSPGSVPGMLPRAIKSVQAFAKLVADWRKEAGFDDLPEDGPSPSAVLSLRNFLERVLRESGLQKLYSKDIDDPDELRLMNLGELVSAAQQFDEEYFQWYDANRLNPVPNAATDFSVDLEEDSDLFEPVPEPPPLAQRLCDYLEQVSLVSDIDSIDANQGAVTLMTLHAAKGLEFDTVAMIGVEDGLLPHSRADEEGREGVEEERRLCFVGITRAQKNLMVTHARYRSIFGRTAATIPSRFLREMRGEHTELIDLGDGDSQEPGELTLDTSMGDAETYGDAFPPGTIVRHAKFGIGRVLKLNAIGANARAQVQFQTAGVKTLVLEYAGLERVD